MNQTTSPQPGYQSSGWEHRYGPPTLPRQPQVPPTGPTAPTAPTTQVPPPPTQPVQVSPAPLPAPQRPQRPAPAGAVLSARGLRKAYGPTVALAGVDLDLRAGESLAVMGASGSGKTTLLHCLAAIIDPDAGSVLLRGTETVGLSEAGRNELRRTAYGFIFQQGHLVPELTAIENAALPLLLSGVGRAQAEAHAAGWLAALGLRGMEQRRIGELSGGQAQRVAIARAQVTSAAVVFADEPTGALDSRTSEEVMGALLGATTGQGRSLVVVTHDADVAARCDRTLLMRDGLVVGEEGRR